MIQFYATGQVKFPCVAWFYEMLFWHQSESNNKQMFEWLIISLFQFVILGSVKNDVCKTFGPWILLEVVDKNVFKIMTLLNDSVLICKFEDHNLVFCSLLVKCVFSAKIWFKKTSTRIMKYESWVIKSNPV